jgi:dihydroorotate dehydrogenase electron transfer subunit
LKQNNGASRGSEGGSEVGPERDRAVPVRVLAEVARNEIQGSAGYRMRLRVPGWPGSQPGQFVMLSAGSQTATPRTDPLLPRPMAVYRSVPTSEGGEVELLYKVVGRGTRLLSETRVGQSVRVIGPLGRPFPESGEGRHSILVGGGTGVGSLHELASRVVRGGTATVILGARTDSELLGREDFAALDLCLRITTEDGSRGERGLVTDALIDELDRSKRPDEALIYACGPTAMMRRCAEIAAERRVPCLVSLENNMACGFGVCLGCAAPRPQGDYRLVCRDGPIFDAREVAWEKLP